MKDDKFPPATPEVDNSNDHDHEHEHDHVHDEAVSSVGITIPGNLSIKKLNNWFAYLMQMKGPDLYRFKGVLSLKGEPNRFVFQGVHMQLDTTEGAPWGDGPRENKLIFIGRDLNRQELEDGFRKCLA